VATAEQLHLAIGRIWGGMGLPAYVIMIRDKMRDETAFKRYAEGAVAARAGHEFDALAFYGASETWEGAEADGIVILSFPDRAAAKAWYESPAYTAAKAHRFQGADYRMMVVEGL